MAEQGPYKLGIFNLEKKKPYFTFDIVLQSAKGDLQGPFAFHLHNTYKPSVIRVRKTDGFQAQCCEIGATGVFTFGVQFLTTDGTWRSLEYDLADYGKGALKRRYRD